VEPDKISVEQCQVAIEFIDLSLFRFDNFDHMVGDKLCDQFISLIDLDIKNPFIIQTFSLYHFSMMNSHPQKNSIHDLTDNELDNLIREPSGKDSHCKYPR